MDIVRASKNGLVVQHSMNKLIGFCNTIVPDIFIIKKSSNVESIPILVVEVKHNLAINSQKDNSLKPAFGQIFDYMMLIRASYGLIDVYGILTDFKDWYFCWFDHSGEIVKSKEIIMDTTKKIESMEDLFGSRNIMNSLYQLGSDDLTKVICSFIIRGMHSRIENSSRKFTDLKILPSLEKNIYSISIFPIKKYGNNFTLNFIYPSNIPQNVIYYSLHRFYQGANGRVSLMCYFDDNIINFVVIKTITTDDILSSSLEFKEFLKSTRKSSKFTKDSDFEIYSKNKILKKMIQNEKAGWKAFGVDIKVLNVKSDQELEEINSRHKYSLILPFCFTLDERLENFDFNFSYLLNQIEDFNDYVPSQLRSASNTFISENKLSFDEILANSIQILEDKNIDYVDKTYRHIGLMPFLGSEGNISFKNVLIDHAINIPKRNVSDQEMFNIQPEQIM